MKSEKVININFKIIYFKNIYLTYLIQGKDAKRDEFTKYLENAGVVDDLTEVLINLYEEENKPKYPTEYIKSSLKSSNAQENEIAIQNIKLREENRKLKQRINELERKIERIQKFLEEKPE